MRILVCLVTLFGIVVSTGCLGNSIGNTTPLQIISSPATRPSTASERPTGTPTQAISQPFTIVSIPSVIPENVQETPTINEAPISTPLDPGLEKIVTEVKDDLAQRLKIDLVHIELKEVASVTWPDGSLGCGKPGTEYLQVVTPGFHILLEADGQVFSYHTNTSNVIILCSEKPPRSISPAPY